MVMDLLAGGEKMRSIFIVLTVCIVLYGVYQIYSVIRFRKKQIQGKADLLADPVYIVTAILVYFLCYGMVISGIVEYLISPEFASGGNLPFVVYGLPLMVLAPTIMLDDGAYAYSPASLYWKNREWDLSAVQIVSVKENEALGRAVIKVKFPSSDPGQYGNKTIRTTVERAEDFLRYCRR